MNTLLPAEWAAQSAVQLTWPSPDGDFGAHFEAAERCFAALGAAITRFQDLLVAYPGTHPRTALEAAGADLSRIRFFSAPSNDVWARDHGPITVLRDGAPVHLDFRFNGWGGKFDASLDDTLTRRLAQAGAWDAPVESIDFVLEGGGIDSDGAGTLLTTRRCLLAPTRNPGLDEAAIAARLGDWLGTDRVLWLSHGDLLGDDTDGHIDTLARFTGPGTIAFQACDDASDPHHALLAPMRAELEALRTRDGRPYHLVPLPLPAPIHADDDGRRLPAGYANFLVINGAVLVPTYGDAADAVALERIGACFPGRAAVPIDCRALIQQHGSLHCVTMQLPAPPDAADE